VRHRSRLVLLAGALIAAPWLAAATGPGGADVHVDVTGLRSANGVVRACLTSRADGFPDCGPGDRELAVPAGGAVSFDFADVARGRYAIALIHDENGNGRMDRALLLMPKEGYGFSRDAPVVMGPPKFGQAAFDVGAVTVRQAIRMRYML
jgi:uncharacterized protein (DUF2141 family)